MVASRDYYVDLELSPSAETTEIKKQYRKLALKYHPDRNPGREQEVNSKFLIIQAAHDVLTDPQQRAKFDATRRSGMGKYPASSGVRGNPWSNVSQQFPTPPKHPSTPSRNPTSGANRWNTRFSSGVPPTARQQTAADAQSKKNTAKAFDNMRSKPPPTAKQAHQNRAPPPTPPRTESARQRAQASFGASKAGKASTHTDHPRQFPYEDEPPATKNGYSSRKDGSRFNLHPESQATPVPDPLRQFREEMAFADGRTRSPYASHGGERTNPFDGADMSRSKSTRETSTREGQGQSPNKEGTWGNGTSFRTEANAKNSSSKKSPPTEARSRRLSGAWPTEETPSRSKSNGHRPSIFNLSENDEAPGPKTSVDDINTSFVNDDAKWQFSAGGAEQSTFTKTRSQSNGRTGRRTPAKRSTMPQSPIKSAGEQPTTPAKEELKGFDADGWNHQFGPQTFVPQTRPTTGSPSKHSRANSMKSKTFKPPNDAHDIVIDDSSDEDTLTWRGRKGANAPVTDSPQAMDIDPPIQLEAESPLPTGVRNIPVEPTRPEWRPGDFATVRGEPNPKNTEEVNPNVAGSEDSDEFKATMADLKNVAPFAETKTGLNSFSGMKDNLPFESKASETIPLEKVPAAQPLIFPNVPSAPHLPPTMAITGMKPNAASWEKYAQEFESYLRQWDTFNGQVTDHFASRKSQIDGLRENKGYVFLHARGDGNCVEYIKSVQQDNDVRRRWNAACELHEQRLGEFMSFKEKMK